MLIWRSVPTAGGVQKRSWQIDGESDVGCVIVQATESELQWTLLCVVPKWEERGTQTTRGIWQGNVTAWLNQLGLRVSVDGAIKVTIEKRTRSEEEVERTMARVATMVAASVLAACFVRSELGVREQMQMAS